MIGELAEMNARSRTASAEIDFSATNRKTKQLITLEGVSFGIGSRTLFKDIHFSITSGMRVGLVGPNGSGKTTLLRLLRGDIKPESGKIPRADGLRIVYFDQNRELDPDITLRRALAPDSDAVIYQDRVIHVAAWAERFLFSAENLNQRVGRLSGGERARVLIAQLMLQPADVLLLDEPTNDLDIPTLEILEESLLEYSGALVLVTHDRFMLDRVSTVVLGLDGRGSAERFADYSQWEAWQRSQLSLTTPKSVNGDRGPRPARGEGPRAVAKKKLSYIEAREFAAMESRISEAEQILHAKRAALEDPAVTSDRMSLQNACTQLDEAQKSVDTLYARWAELEKKQK
jgi:ATP-binding cassette subfamily F protein uup